MTREITGIEFRMTQAPANLTVGASGGTNATSRSRSDVNVKAGDRNWYTFGVQLSMPNPRMIFYTSPRASNRCTPPCLRPRKSESAKLDQLPFLVFTHLRVAAWNINFMDNIVIYLPFFFF